MLEPITIAGWGYDRTRALMTGEVKVEGCDVTFLDLEPEEMFHRALHFEEFDATELSFSNYLTLTARDACPYVAIPAFPGRRFRHQGIYINTESGIKGPEDLKGRIVGTPEYQVTASVWIRGIFEDEFGILPSDIRWRAGGLYQPARTEKVTFQAPEGVELKRIEAHQTLSQMLLDGEIDALLGPRAPTGFGQPGVPLARLFPDYIEREKDYFRRTGIFPIMHLIVVHKKKVAALPWLPVSLYKAFEAAKDMAIERLMEENEPMATYPWIDGVIEEAQSFMGKDFWPYGLEANRTTLEAFLRYHYDQGLADRKLELEEIFVPSTLSRSRI
ncbi:MAG: ABC transporter substrate-binding protein [Alphaproteobacteria bacterium]|nr:ABC transporter substrate-binding protein [Alphaproteobacteria bacterium]